MNYTIQCTDQNSGEVGCFLFDESKFTETGKFYAISPVFKSMIEFFEWDNKNPQRIGCGKYVPGPND